MSGWFGGYLKEEVTRKFILCGWVLRLQLSWENILVSVFLCFSPNATRLHDTLYLYFAHNIMQCFILRILYLYIVLYQNIYINTIFSPILYIENRYLPSWKSADLRGYLKIKLKDKFFRCIEMYYAFHIYLNAAEKYPILHRRYRQYFFLVFSL